MKLLCLKNLLAQEVDSIDSPWKLGKKWPAFSTKAEFQDWCRSPETKYCFVSAAEGKCPSLRCSELNPPTRLYGLITDYDEVPKSPVYELIIKNAPEKLRPFGCTRSFSGNLRTFYRFEEPVGLLTPSIAKKLMERLTRTLKLRRISSGFEESALLDLCHYYALGVDFTPIGDGLATIPRSLINGILEEITAKHDWAEEGPILPMSMIRKAAAEKYGDDAWPHGWDYFQVGARGRRFWDPDSKDNSAVIVRETGCQYFSDGGGWKSWADLLGPEVIANLSTQRIGEATQDKYYDGRVYWSPSGTGKFRQWSESDVRLELNARYSLSKKSRNGQPSLVDSAIHGIHTNRRVDAAMPFLYIPTGTISLNGRTYLNTSSVTPVAPHPGTVPDFGAGFPQLAGFLNSLFHPPQQREYFLSWLKHFYVGAINGKPQRGLALFIAGPAGVGKTFLGKVIIGRLMGGAADAAPFLVAGDKFNEKLFAHPVWNVDDAVLSSDPRERARFSQMVKTVTANDSFSFRAMYRAGEDLRWLGRVVVTLNDDPEALRILPEVDINILDKVMLLKTTAHVGGPWPTDVDLDTELPHFGAWLRDWSVPDHLRPNAAQKRFGVVPYSQIELLNAATSLSDETHFEDLLLEWGKEFFGPGGPGENCEDWSGTPTALISEISRNESISKLLERNYGSATKVGIQLSKLLKKGVSYLSRHDHRRWTISRTIGSADV